MKCLHRAASALSLGGVLLLSACGSSNTHDMYRDGIETTTPSPTEQAAQSNLPPQRLAAMKSFGLDETSQPIKLVGMSSFDVKQVLGDPSFVRKDNGVEIWQYRHEDCILDLFLYEDRRGLSVDHSELRGPELDQNGQPSCFQTILMGQS
ncbi:hypothetical protein [Terasakiella sp. SH-1]|uniref:hypothetical protein n=1 Tax=Terasakiella sp. SH-1 TaxID=2560057 RepID=UPI001074732E|nr:hypothetical protein [Terasakiella sp. SH-1]